MFDNSSCIWIKTQKIECSTNIINLFSCQCRKARFTKTSIVCFLQNTWFNFFRVITLKFDLINYIKYFISHREGWDGPKCQCTIEEICPLLPCLMRYQGLPVVPNHNLMKCQLFQNTLVYIAHRKDDRQQHEHGGLYRMCYMFQFQSAWVQAPCNPKSIYQGIHITWLMFQRLECACKDRLIRF